MIVAAPVVSREQMQRVHEALRITTPLDACTPMMLRTLACIAHCWRDRIPANLWRDLDSYLDPTPNESYRQHQLRCPVERDPELIDIKRRAAGDND